MALLRIENVSMSFGGLQALSDISFEIAEREVVALIGPNGAGKTTLMNVINGVYSPNKGRIWFKDTQITDWPPHAVGRVGIGRTFQIEEPFKNMTTLENIAVGFLFGAARRKVRVKGALEEGGEILRELGLGEKLHLSVNQLTTGERKRLELGKALSMRPDLLLLDEVMAGLNHREIEDMINFVKRVHQSGVSVVIIEHVMKAIMAVSERVVVLHHGSLIADGPPENVVNDRRVIEAYLGPRYAAARGFR